MFVFNCSRSHHRSFTTTLVTTLARTWVVAMLLASPPNALHASNTAWGENYFPNHELTAHDGEKLRFFDDVISDKVVAINFIFTSCDDICPLETARLADVYRLLGERVGQDIHFYSITIDPENDTKEVLAEYVKRFGIDGSKWKFLTGNKDHIDEIRAKFGVFEREAEEEDLSNHNINLVLGNQSTGRWLRRSPFENPHILAHQLGTALHQGKTSISHSNRDYAKAPALRQLSTGEMMFRDRCSSCHVINGGFAPVRSTRQLGPDLFAVHERRNLNWLKRWLAEPDAMLREKDPIAVAMDAQFEVTMPNFSLDQTEIESLIAYFDQETERLRLSGAMSSHEGNNVSTGNLHKHQH